MSQVLTQKKIPAATGIQKQTLTKGSVTPMIPVRRNPAYSQRGQEFARLMGGRR